MVDGLGGMVGRSSLSVASLLCGSTCTQFPKTRQDGTRLMGLILGSIVKPTWMVVIHLHGLADPRGATFPCVDVGGGFDYAYASDLVLEFSRCGQALRLSGLVPGGSVSAICILIRTWSLNSTFDVSPPYRQPSFPRNSDRVRMMPHDPIYDFDPPFTLLFQQSTQTQSVERFPAGSRHPKFSTKLGFSLYTKH